MQAQVVLDRLGFTPGVVDGKMGMSTVNAIKGFQEARGMPITGELDEPTVQALAEWKHIPATRVVTIPAEFANDASSQFRRSARIRPSSTGWAMPRSPRRSPSGSTRPRRCWPS